MYGTLRIPLQGFHYFSVVHIAKCDAIQKKFYNRTNSEFLKFHYQTLVIYNGYKGSLKSFIEKKINSIKCILKLFVDKTKMFELKVMWKHTIQYTASSNLEYS